MNTGYWQGRTMNRFSEEDYKDGRRDAIKDVKMRVFEAIQKADYYTQLKLEEIFKMLEDME